MDQDLPPLRTSSPSIPAFDNATPLPSNLSVRKKSRFDNIYLIFSFFLFVLSLGFMMSTPSQTITSTSSAQEKSNAGGIQKTAATRKDFPKAYKEEQIQASVYTGAESFSDTPASNADEYIKAKVMKFYIYKDVLEENNEKQVALVPTTYKDIHQGVEAMEPFIKEHLLSQAFFGYIQAKFAGAAGEPELKQKYGDLDQKAQSIIKRYQQLFVTAEYSPIQIIDISNKDEELLSLNDTEENKIIENYDASMNIFSDRGFNEFLFTQSEHQLSDLYTLHDASNQPYGYIVVYPTKLLTKKYHSLDQLLQEHSSYFTY